MRGALISTFSAAAIFGSLFFASTAKANAKRGVGLGAAAGIAVPHAAGDLRLKPHITWGFYVDIPLISTFHITPSATLYGYSLKSGSFPDGTDGGPRTDISLTFKFVIPLGLLEVWAGATGGVTSSARIDPHVGGEAGVSFNLISNLDLFVSANYRWVLNKGTDIRTAHVFAGPLFRFR